MQPIAFLLDNPAAANRDVDLSKIIEAAAKDPLGIVALSLVVIAVLALAFFRTDSVRVRLSVFFSVMVVSSGIFGFTMIQEYRSLHSGDQATKAAKSTGVASPTPTPSINADRITQSTQGEKSPAVISGGNTTITNGDSANNSTGKKK